MYKNEFINGFVVPLCQMSAVVKESIENILISQSQRASRLKYSTGFFPNTYDAKLNCWFVDFCLLRFDNAPQSKASMQKNKRTWKIRVHDGMATSMYDELRLKGGHQWRHVTQKVRGEFSKNIHFWNFSIQSLIFQFNLKFFWKIFQFL